MANAQTEQARAPQALEADEFSSLLNKAFKPKTDQAREAVEQAVRTLAEQALVNTKIVSADAYQSIEAIIAELDRKLSEQVNVIMHHEEFQQRGPTPRRTGRAANVQDLVGKDPRREF